MIGLEVWFFVHDRSAITSQCGTIKDKVSVMEKWPTKIESGNGGYVEVDNWFASDHYVIVTKSQDIHFVRCNLVRLKQWVEKNP